MLIERKSSLTGVVHMKEIDVTPAQIAAWRNGTLIQVAMPDLSVEDREFIMTGATAEEWDEAFAEDE